MASPTEMTGAELVAAFVHEFCFPKVFLVTGGACAFIVDALGRNDATDYVCVQHEQAAAMAVDGVWRVTGKVGVTCATSGPGATNLLTGIACSWFDSIPAIHITGQVNQRESAQTLGVSVRQAGFQETDIVSIAAPLTKWAIQVTSVAELAETLPHALSIAQSGRMGPVLIDIPMDVQQDVCTPEDLETAFTLQETCDEAEPGCTSAEDLQDAMAGFVNEAERPLFILGAGLGLSGTARVVQEFCEASGIPYLSSWGGMPFLDRSREHYFGSLGVYGDRIGNLAVQSADRLVGLGTRLDNRQRTGNPSGFAPFARILVVDIDGEELGKFAHCPEYTTMRFDLAEVAQALPSASGCQKRTEWVAELVNARVQLASVEESAADSAGMSPYRAVPIIQSRLRSDAIVVADCGANLCWVYQSWGPGDQQIFTAGGNSPMGYSLPAAIGAQIAQPDRQVVCFIGDGGLQMNIQELQTIIHYQLPINIVILNNNGYGIIKQFQDAYFEGRYHATGRGYSQPDFEKIAGAYGIEYTKISTITELDNLEIKDGPGLIDIWLPEDSSIIPKAEMDRFLHDQFPYGDSAPLQPIGFEYPERPSQLGTSV